MRIPPLSPVEFDGPVAVITGGWSGERDRSLLSGHTVMESLLAQGIKTRMIDLEDDRETLVTDLHGTSLAVLAIAGRGAEDGRLQGLLETLGVDYTGSGVLTSALGMNKVAAKAHVGAAGVRTVGSSRINPTADPAEEAKRIADDHGLPVVIKPISEGGSIGVVLDRSLDEVTEVLRGAGRMALMAETYSSGRSVSVGVLETSDGALTVLPPLEAETREEIYSYTAKRTRDATTYHCPARVSDELLTALRNQATLAHQALHCHSHSRHDFVVSETAGAVWLEVNTLPGLSRGGNLARMARAADLSYEQLLAHIVRGARTDRRAKA
ncbi:hypothetical protein ACFXGT_27735 [Streptomyces sp. NPDC059352]|uniref:D-alanine--D-alanine ligase family protein n=1 Tax=Streptomyces sp. NPDC059352 TaxID=3346810 RepID=UPI0036BDB126